MLRPLISQCNVSGKQRPPGKRQSKDVVYSKGWVLAVVFCCEYPVSQFGHIWTYTLYTLAKPAHMPCFFCFHRAASVMSRSESKHWRLCATAAAVISLKGECRSGRREPDAIQVQVKNSWTSYHFISLHITSYHFMSLHITSYHFISLHGIMASIFGPTGTNQDLQLCKSRAESAEC